MRGFSLVEALFATGLLAIAVLGLAQVLAMSIAVSTSSARATAAAALAAQKVEQLRAGGDLADGEDRQGGFRRRWTVRAIAGTAGALHVVQVTVDPSGPRASGARSPVVTAVVRRDP